MSENEGSWSSWWKSASDSLNEQVNSIVSNLPSNEELKEKLGEWGTKAGDYLDQADRRIEELENSALESFKHVGEDIKHFMDEPLATLEGPETEQAGGVLFSSDRITTSRLEAQIRSLNKAKDVFTTKEKLDGDIESQTDRIADYLSTYAELRETFESLVPEKVEYKQFWLKYFAAREEIESQDRQRKALLAKQTEEEVEDWGSDSDEPVEVNRPASASKGSPMEPKDPEDPGDSDSDWE
ncbi:BSD domain-containing protein C22A12.14c [Wickerhamiella sorbophila]|uniref:BSD domain-containing protein C22A12.14c n=1 Tax=Wickerhamiella sorbophila TaxID=45607 RepID=A0A2T0FBJ6_9ASCO|nr:BSD domain-containing protein C22A12.14c [Wickerhamiella sorbophila]PRT52384.1 BSD domain-containing protein C22A12.14c [Wickerhamiella sorbophila]